MIRHLVLALLFTLTVVTPVLASPQIIVEQLKYDFGKVVQGEQVEYTYRFQNAGDQILELGNVSTSCGCTAALLTSRRIAPGDSGELKVKFDSTRFQGEIHKAVTLETNDPQHQQVVFDLTGTVQAEVVVSPERINWGSVAAGQELTATVTISNQGRTALNLQPPQSTSDNLSAELSSRQIPPGGQITLNVRGKINPDKTRTSGYIIITTDYANVPQIRVPVTARLAK